jgi:hypothetical protein
MNRLQFPLGRKNAEILRNKNTMGIFPFFASFGGEIMKKKKKTYFSCEFSFALGASISPSIFSHALIILLMNDGLGESKLIVLDWIGVCGAMGAERG